VTEVVSLFRKSSYSAGEGACVEVAATGTGTGTGSRAVRDSKNPHGARLYLSPDGWHAFLAGTKNGALGHFPQR
jgi:hypothetical protein